MVVGEASTCADALALATGTHPDVIVLDLDVGGENAVESIPTLLRMAPDTRILVLTGVRDPELHRQAIRQGALLPALGLSQTGSVYQSLLWKMSE